jgi:hypothetical protein
VLQKPLHGGKKCTLSLKETKPCDPCEDRRKQLKKDKLKLDQSKAVSLKATHALTKETEKSVLVASTCEAMKHGNTDMKAAVLAAKKDLNLEDGDIYSMLRAWFPASSKIDNLIRLHGLLAIDKKQSIVLADSTNPCATSPKLTATVLVLKQTLDNHRVAEDALVAKISSDEASLQRCKSASTLNTPGLSDKTEETVKASSIFEDSLKKFRMFFG